MNEMSRKKPYYKVNEQLHEYLVAYGRETDIPVSYDDLLRCIGGIPLYDKQGADTLWETKLYDPATMEDLDRGLTMIYSLLKTDGDISVMEHLSVERIDFCTFGNTKPFRVRIVNRFNDNYDYFYLKRADASRVYGLELEHGLSPNRINYIVDGESLVEEHIAGIPGDQFIRTYMELPNFNPVRMAKEFVKFNERCFVKLLGDMRSYNFVVDVTPDFEEEQYRIRAIDFDQQCYEGKKSLYLPQFFKENNPFVNLAVEVMTPETVKQYQYEERTLMAKRLRSARHRLKDLIDCIREDTVSEEHKVVQLRSELAKHHKNSDLNKCESMGEVLRSHLRLTLTESKMTNHF